MARTRLKWLVLPALCALVSPALGSDRGMHHDPVAGLALALVVVLVAAKLGGDLAARLKQPAVLGELLAGMLLGNLGLVGYAGLEPLRADVHLDMLARLGVLVLLFQVGLESTVAQMLAVGRSALLVAVLGVIAPFALGWGVGAWLLPFEGPYVHAFLGATLSATSVGITARVLKDLGASQSREARVILGAAVIDDVLGLILLAAVTGAIVAANQGGHLSYGRVGLILGKAIGFLVGALFVGVYLSPRVFAGAARLRAPEVLLALGLASCFLFAWLSDALGLAPIVGAFAAGLILEPLHYTDFVSRGEAGLEALVHPISAFLGPIFFVLMGMRTDLRAFAQPGVLVLAAALTFAAVLGKQLCSLGVLDAGADRLTVGLGMIPRGEVGLIFANIGLSLSIDGHSIIAPSTYSAVVVMVIVTTMLTPPALRASLARANVGGDLVPPAPGPPA